MKRFGTVLCAVICFTLSFGPAGFAEETQAQQAPAKPEEAPPGVTGTGSLGVYNKYVFRGYELSRKSVVFQPALTASYAGFSASFWGNIDSSQNSTQSFVPDNGHKSFNEVDLTLSYTKNFGKLGLTGGYIYYGTKYTDETEEVFASVSYDVIGKPTLSIYRDINKYLGTYLNFSLAHSIKLGGDVTLDLGASAGYMAGDSAYWKTYEPSTGAFTGSKYQAFHDGKVQAGLTIPVSKKVTVVPIVQYWFPLSSDSKKHWADMSYNPNGYLGTVFVGGASVNYNF